MRTLHGIEDVSSRMPETDPDQMAIDFSGVRSNGDRSSTWHGAGTNGRYGCSLMPSITAGDRPASVLGGSISSCVSCRLESKRREWSHQRGWSAHRQGSPTELTSKGHGYDHLPFSIGTLKGREVGIRNVNVRLSRTVPINDAAERECPCRRPR